MPKVRAGPAGGHGLRGPRDRDNRTASPAVMMPTVLRLDGQEHPDEGGHHGMFWF